MTYSSTHQYENSPVATSQSKPIPGKSMVMNHAGGFVFETPLAQRVLRFLIQGSDSTYYAGKREITLDAAKSVFEMAQTDGVGLVKLIVKANTSTQLKDGSWIPAASNNKNASIFALAVALQVGDMYTRTAAHDAIWDYKIVSTLRQLAQLLKDIYVLNSSGQARLDGKIPMGNGRKGAIQMWFLARDSRWLAMQFLKYGSSRFRIGDPDSHVHRDWNDLVIKDDRKEYVITSRDILRISHPDPEGNSVRDALFKFATNRYVDNSSDKKVSDTEMLDKFTALSRKEKGKDKEAVDMILAWDEARNTDNLNTVLDAIKNYGLTWEMIDPKWFNNDKKEQRNTIWKTLMGIGSDNYSMPLTALIRNLPRFSDYGLLEDKEVRSFLKGTFSSSKTLDVLMRARLHPLAILQAMMIHKRGFVYRPRYVGGRMQEVKTLEWRPDNALMGWLEDAYHQSFGTVVPVGNRVGYFFDTSGSMRSGRIGGLDGLTPMMAQGCLASTLTRTEEDFMAVAFTSGNYGLTPLSITKHDSLDGVVSKLNAESCVGGTDCALPFLWATKERFSIDTFVMMTDNQTWNNSRYHPTQALAEYRRLVNPNARCVFISFTTTRASLNDPDDRLSMEFVGFDASAPILLNNFARGDI